MLLTITNKPALDDWMNERRKMGRDLKSIKGNPPTGATYSDGDPIERPVNVAWQDVKTGELFAIEYAQQDQPHD